MFNLNGNTVCDDKLFGKGPAKCFACWHQTKRTLKHWQRLQQRRRRTCHHVSTVEVKSQRSKTTGSIHDMHLTSCIATLASSSTSTRKL
jgi:hypothetical protein